MGNQPSSPATPAPPSNPPPPISIACDADCQRQKDLKLLKSSMDLAAKNKESDPTTYEQARIKYYTLLEGQSWLKTEKERVAKTEVEPVVSGYTTKYSDLKKESSTNNTFVNLANTVKSQQENIDEKNLALKNQLSAQSNKANALERLYELTGLPAGITTMPYIPIILDVIIGILGVIVAYLLFTKISSIFSPPSPVEDVILSGGKRR
jgi:hypothetical protein